MIILKAAAALLSAIIMIFSASGITEVVPYLAVIPDMVRVGKDYINLQRNEDAISKKELKTELEANRGKEHPFVLATKENFDVVRQERLLGDFSEYTEKLNESVIGNADALLDMTVYPLMAYELDEEDSILPISREVINRMVILGSAWQITGEKKYAERAWLELENVCGYDDWCTGHFLATAEMAFAVSIGYDWLFDYLTQEQKDLLAEKTLEYAVTPALSKNYLKNWFTWSKNNWNSICYGGIGIACMTFSEYFPDEAAEFLSMCYANMPIAFENFTPGGVYAEGPGYSNSGMNAIVYFVATSKNFFGTDFENRRIVVGGNDTLSLGSHELTFVTAPMVHWPEVIVSYDSADKVLFSADGFGKFGALDADEDWACEARRYYFGIVGKYGAQVQLLLKKASALDIQIICPLHGPILTENLGYYIGLYDTWSSYGTESEGIVIAYTSVYGNTKKAVEILAEKLREKGCPKVAVTDLARDDMAEAVEDAFRYGKIVLATTTYNGEIFPFMREFINHLTERNYQNKTVALVENGSWAPLAAKVMKEMLANCKNLTFAETSVKIMSAVNEENLAQLDALADELCK